MGNPAAGQQPQSLETVFIRNCVKKLAPIDSLAEILSGMNYTPADEAEQEALETLHRQTQLNALLKARTTLFEKEPEAFLRWVNKRG